MIRKLVLLSFILLTTIFVGLGNIAPMNGYFIEKNIIEETSMFESIIDEPIQEEVIFNKNTIKNIYIEKTLNKEDIVKEAIVKGKNVVSSNIQIVSEQKREKELVENQVVEDNLTIDFIDVGQGDSTLISYDGEYFLIDVGNESSSEKLKDYLSKKEITNLKYILITHEDMDHMGGLSSLLDDFSVSKILISSFFSEKEIYDDLRENIENKSIIIEHPKEGDSYKLGDGEVYFKIIIAPEGSEDMDTFKSTNSFSIGTMLYHKNFTALFMGDAHEGMELDLINSNLNLDIDVYKVSNHGSNSSSCIDFLEAMTPKAAIISCGEDNIEGYPRVEVLYNLKQLNVPIYRTDDQGTITLTSDGKNFDLNCNPSNNYKGRDGTIHKDMENYFIKSEKYSYVLNVKCKKIHIDGCSGIKNILNEDIEYSNRELSNLLKDYECCKICLPQNEADLLINKIFKLVNEERKKLGIEELSWSDDLEITSNIRVEEIKSLFSHMRPNHEEWYTVDSNIMYGENLAKDYNTSEDVFNAWMESITHKENIIFPDFKTISISISKDSNGKYYWAQEFGY